MKQFWSMTAKADVMRVDIYDVIGFLGVSAADFAREWRDTETKASAIEVHISSPGGNMYDGLAIYNVIQQSKKPVDVYIDGLAASAASLIAMAGRKTLMAENGLFMMHAPSTITAGNENAHEAAMSALKAGKEALIVAYQQKSGKTRDEIAALLDADNGYGTWYGANEAKDAGFVDEVISATPIAAYADAQKHGYQVPAPLQALLTHKEPEKPAERNLTMSDESKTPEGPKPATLAELEAACDGASAEFVLAQLKAQATVAQAMGAWNKELLAKVAEKENAIAEMKAKQPEVKEVPGVAPLEDGAKPRVADTDPITQWNAMVDEKLAKCKSRAEAIKAVSSEHPELHDAYIAAYNAKQRSK